MENKKRKHHYVFQAYLNAWIVDGKLWSLRNKKVLFHTNTINIAQERDFYRLKPLNEDEFKFYQIYMKTFPSDVQYALLKHLNSYLTPVKRKYRSIIWTFKNLL